MMRSGPAKSGAKLAKMDSESAVRIGNERVDARRLSKLVYYRWQMEPNNVSVSIMWLPLIFRVYHLADVELRFFANICHVLCNGPGVVSLVGCLHAKGYRHRYIGLIWYFRLVLLAPVVYYLWRYMCSIMAPNLEQKRTIS